MLHKSLVTVTSKVVAYPPTFLILKKYNTPFFSATSLNPLHVSQSWRHNSQRRKQNSNTFLTGPTKKLNEVAALGNRHWTLKKNIT